jgi:hypothetical protein
MFQIVGIVNDVKELGVDEPPVFSLLAGTGELYGAQHVGCSYHR